MSNLFQKRLKELRASRGLSQKQLGEIVGVSYSAVRYWETRVKKLRATHLVKLALYFGVSTDYLLGLVD